jgi:Uma2 family endonuclease
MSQAIARTFDLVAPDFIPESELIDSDGVPLDSIWQRKQINLCTDVIQQAFAERGREDCFVGGNMFVYYTPEQARAVAAEVRQLPLFAVPKEGLAARPSGKKPFKGPDVFAVTGGVTPRKRKVWASWLEDDRLPDFVFELQSKSTAHIDAGEKRQLYAEVFKTREYFYYGPDDPELGEHRDVLVGLRLVPGGGYAPIEPDERGWIRSEVLGLYLGRWDGRYDREDDRWIRLYDAQGRLVPTEAEREHRLKEQERQLKEQEQQLREQAEKRAEEAEKRADAADAEIRRLLGSDDS